jgi:hypothetical protein
MEGGCDGRVLRHGAKDINSGCATFVSEVKPPPGTKSGLRFKMSVGASRKL